MFLYVVFRWTIRWWCPTTLRWTECCGRNASTSWTLWSKSRKLAALCFSSRSPSSGTVLSMLLMSHVDLDAVPCSLQLYWSLVLSNIVLTSLAMCCLFYGTSCFYILSCYFCSTVEPQMSHFLHIFVTRSLVLVKFSVYVYRCTLCRVSENGLLYNCDLFYINSRESKDAVN